MTDQVHPRALPTVEQQKSEIPAKSAAPTPGKLAAPPHTYVVQIPKDQIYRQPPQENSRRYENYQRRKSSRSCYCRCICWTLGLLILLILLIAIAVGVFYFVFRPEAPNYSVQKLSVKGFNLTLSDLTISPEFDVTVKAENPNKKIGIYYEKGSSVTITHSGTQLCTGVLPDFYQPTKNVTVFQTTLLGSGIHLTTEVHNALTEEQKKGQIPLGLKIEVPVRIKVGSIKTWTVTVKVDCDIVVDKLTADSRIVSKSCDVKVIPWQD